MNDRHPVHPAAARGFDLAADAYDRGRPGYPSEAVDFLFETIAIGPRATVADIGAGTGKLTGALARTGADVIAVEPVAAMREVLSAALPGIRAVDGTAEACPLGEASVDVVVCAQAFHWFDGPRAVEEFARILRPGGRLGIVFNVRDESDPVQRALGRIWEGHRGDTPTHRGGAWQAVFEPADRFSPLAHRAFANEQRVDADGLVDRVVSVSFMATLPSPGRERIAREVRSLVGGAREVVLPYRTDVFWSQLL